MRWERSHPQSLLQVGRPIVEVVTHPYPPSEVAELAPLTTPCGEDVFVGHRAGPAVAAFLAGVPSYITAHGWTFSTDGTDKIEQLSPTYTTLLALIHK